MAKKKKTKKSAEDDLKKVVNEVINERIEFENKRVGAKVDVILDEEPKNINVRKLVTGNGGIGLCEKFRTHTLYFRATWTVICFQWGVILFLAYLVIAGGYRGMTPEKIREAIAGAEIEQVELAPVIDQKPVIIIEENKPEIEEKPVIKTVEPDEEITDSDSNSPHPGD